MMEETKMIKDRFSIKDRESMMISMPDFPKEMKQNKGIWRRTEVLCGFGDIIENPNGKSSFAPGCPFTTSENMVPIGGVQYMMEMLYGVKGTQIPIPTMYEINGIGRVNSAPVTDTYKTPDGSKALIYRTGHLVQLFGIGITGTAENDVTVYPVDYREKDINMTRVTEDGLTLRGTMLPFRYTSTVLSSTERKKYFGKKTFDNGYSGYYLKRFESDPVIKHVWKTGEDTDEETLVSSADVWDNTVGRNVVESFTECICKVSYKDVKEWFAALAQEDRTRINTIATFSGRYVTNPNDPGDPGDYQDVRLFSKLNIPVEYLTLNKDLNIIYRSYGA